jgi:hypothetical protein
MKKEFAVTALKSLLQTSTQNQSIAPQNAQKQFIGTKLKVVSLEYVKTDVVYDISVDVDKCFYANGVLVHNCVRYAFNTFLGDWYITHLKKSKYKTLPLQ